MNEEKLVSPFPKPPFWYKETRQPPNIDNLTEYSSFGEQHKVFMQLSQPQMPEYEIPERLASLVKTLFANYAKLISLLSEKKTCSPGTKDLLKEMQGVYEVIVSLVEDYRQFQATKELYCQLMRHVRLKKDLLDHVAEQDALMTATLANM